MNLLKIATSENAYKRLLGDNGVDSTKARAALTSILCVAATCAMMGFLAGYLLVRHEDSRALYGLVPTNPLRIAFTYNKTFTLPPTNTSNAAWDDLFPAGAGFVRHPTLSTDTSGVAVFHQLHCLNQLRLGYYDTNRIEHLSDMAHERAHARHCFDYLRQSLMCAADSNLEPVNPQLRGVTGWGNIRVCRDFGRIADWATQWKAELDTILE